MKSKITKVKRTASFICALCVLISACFIVSCGEKKPADTTVTAQSTQLTTAADTTEFEEPVIPDKNYGGRDFNILYLEWGLFQHYFFADSETGEGINDVIYNRQTKIEEKLNINMTRVGDPDFNGVHQQLKKSVLAGDEIGRASCRERV